MVDVGEKTPTHRTADAGARVFVNEATSALIRDGGMKKGDVRSVAQVAGIMGAKRTPELIPMCHPVQMEALTAAATAALTVYDMCKAVQRDIVIPDIRLLEKTGGVHGDFRREETK